MKNNLKNYQIFVKIFYNASFMLDLFDFVKNYVLKGKKNRINL